MEEFFPPALPPKPPRSDGIDLQPLVIGDDPSSYSAALWDWGDLLDFSVDDHLSISLDSDQLQDTPPPPPPPLPQQSDPSPESGSDRVRKRDPRLTCSNFLEGRIPCSCPEIDEKLEHEGLPGKKRVRTGSSVTQCQVPGCEADIRELKGYHRRHRVCLRCANASSVVLDEETKRYCQQCGKFHVLSDFDEGKRSCRRKLERHNNRRRRKPVDDKGVPDKEHQGAFLNEDITIDGGGKDNVCLSDQIADQEASLNFEDQHISSVSSAPLTQSINTDSAISLVASGGTQSDEGKNDTKSEHSPSYCDNKSTYSSVCPTGRISFKLYDWNPAEFPRRLRHQIFQWLASMPVELEGYIRPGCTILTVFIAMPENMWAKLFADPVTYLHDFIIKPGKILSGRGSITVHLNNMIFHVIKAGTSVKKVNVKLRAPRLNYVYPTCFEAGKPIELIACGSNLLQPKFRFLVSFAGKYLAYDYSFASSHGQDGKESTSFNHQQCKIYTGHSDPNLFGPAFVEVENESGLSNFIPVIIGDEAICSEMKSIERKFDASLFTEGQEMFACDTSKCSCKDFQSRQTAFSGLLLDIAWSVKVPTSECTEQTLNRCQIKRYNRVLNYLLQSKCPAILEKVLQNLEILVEKMGIENLTDGTCENDLRVLQENMNLAKNLYRERRDLEDMTVYSECALLRTNFSSQSSFQLEIPSSILTTNQDLEARVNCNVGVNVASTTICRSETDPLLNKEVIVTMNLGKEWPRKSCTPIYAPTALRSRPTKYLIATAIVCFAVCAVIYHPQKVTELAVSICNRLGH